LTYKETSMIEKTLDWMKGFFTDQSKMAPVELEFAREKRVKRYWDPATRKVVEINRERPDNAHEFLSLDSLANYVLGIAEDGSRTNHPVNVWVGDNEVTVECLENDPKDIVCLRFEHTPLFKLLLDLVKRPSLPQQQAIKLLRQQFAPFDVGQKAITTARSLKIHTTDDDERDHSALAARVGKSVVQQAVGAEHLPDRLVVLTPVFTTSSDQCTVDVFLSVDFANRGCILFEPNEQQLHDAVAAERLSTFNHLSKLCEDTENVHIYEGKYHVN
jgi:hypothetical protein